LTVYEGDWDHQYKARFEIWFKDNNGQENKLAEQIRLINGWER
jgi:RecB family exonuclease